MASIPFGTGLGADLEWDGSNTIYATLGRYKNLFYKYDIPTDTWSVLPNTPETIYYGSALVWDGTDLWATRGAYQYKMWKFDVSENSWVVAGITGAYNGSGSDMIYDGKVTSI